jgi:hypothetical protein
VRGDFVCIAIDDTAGDADVFGVGSVVKQEVFAKILLASPAEITCFAGGGIGSHYALTQRKSGDVFADGHYVSGQLMTEDRRRNNHARVVAALENLDIGPTGKRHLHFDEDVSPVDHRHGHRLYLQVFLAVENSSHHLAFSHYEHL